MRKLKTSDIPVLCRCVKKLGLKDQIKAAPIYKDILGSDHCPVGLELEI